MDCSSGEATDSAMVFGLAPGYVARTTIVGGTTSGYSLIGRRHMASRPSRKTAAERTPAKIGRRMKKCEKSGDDMTVRIGKHRAQQNAAGVRIEAIVKRLNVPLAGK